MADKSAKKSPLETAGGAYVGYRRAGRRPESQQDRQASANIPVAVARGFVSGTLGMPGDIESLVRLPYELITGKESPTILPTSEDIEKRLPFRGASQTPVGQFFTGASQLAGGAYTGPLSGARAAMAVPKAVYRAGKDFVQAAGQPATNVIKPKGGNWLSGSVEGALKDLKTNKSAAAALEEMRRVYPPEVMARMSDETRAQVERAIPHLEKQVAINNWIDRNLANYVKKEMATPEDPVRKLAEQGVLHIEPQGGAVRAHANRSVAGMPVDPTSTSPLARAWEDVSDAAVVGSPYKDFLRFGESMDEGLRRVGGEFAVKNPEAKAYSIDDIGTTASNLGFDHIVDVLKQDLAAGRIRPEQLSKVSMEQAVRRTYEFDQEMAKKMREAQIKATEGMPVHKEYPEGYRWVELAAPDYNKLPIEERKQMIARLKEEAKQKGLTPEDYIERYPESQLEAALKYEGETMGHCVGGYCPDVLEGRSRIYSLRDAKGEPHVTVEVRPGGNRGIPDNEYIRFYQQAAEQMGIPVPRNWSDMPREGYNELNQLAIRLAEEYKKNAPDEIVQIKGKQNAAPKEEYLPFVQDFVRGGQWSGVGDFKNTGLIRKSDLIDKFKPDELDAIGKGEYLTKGEYDDLLLNALKPEAGMKRGGKVSISDNCDCQMMDVMDKKLAGGGLIKGLKTAAKATRGTQDVLPAAEREANLQRMLAESKTPMRLYHGTTASEGGKGQEAIRRLKPSKEGSLGSGVYLTPQTAHASNYSGIPNDEGLALMAKDPYAKQMADQFMADRVSGTVREGQQGGNMLPVYAQIKNPLILEGRGDPMVEALIKLGMDEASASRMVERAYENKGYIGKEVETRARAAGYDGLMQYRDGDLSEVVSYNPNAVKSAIGNKGTYDTTKPELNEAGGGLIKGLKAAVKKEPPAVNRLDMNYKDVTKRVPELTEAAKKIPLGEVTSEEYAKLVNKFKPVKPYEFVPQPATAEDATRALTANKKAMFGKTKEIPAGQPTDLRLDIPAYKDHGVWVNSVHRKGEPTAYGSVSSVKNATMFGAPDKALRVATGEAAKGPWAVISGEWNPMDEAAAVKSAQEYLNHKDWRQVGYDPERHGYFYDRQTMAPVLGAEEVIQIGPLVLAKKPKFGDPKDFPFKHGGEVHMAVGGLARMAKAAKAAKAEPSLPLNLPRAAPKTKEEIRPVAQRMAQQMTGEFVRPDPKKSINPAGKSLKQFQMERELSHDIRPTEGRTLLPQEVADIEKQQGMLKIGVSGDTTIADKTLYRAGPYELDLPSPQHGGPLYGLGGEGAWASNNPVAATFQKRVQELSQANKDAPVLGQFLAMGPQGSNFALHFADANLRAIDLSKMNKRQIEQFNKLISEGTEKSGPRPGFPGIEDKESAYLHFAFDPELRKRFNELMQLPKYTEKLGLPDGRVILHAITEPELRNTEVLTSGLSQMRLDPSVNPADLMLSAHPTYSHVIPKVPESAISRTRYPVPAELEFPDVAEFIKKEYRPRDATRVYQTATPRQMVDPQHIDEMKMYEELMKEYTGKKAGGAVNDGLIKVQNKRKAKA